MAQNFYKCLDHKSNHFKDYHKNYAKSDRFTAEAIFRASLDS